MSELMGAWMDECVDLWIDGWMSELMNESIGRLMVG